MQQAGSSAVRVSRWAAGHPAALDLVVAVLLGATLVPAGAWLAGWPGLLISAALLGPLAVRRRFPLAVLAWTGPVAAAQVVLLSIPLPADLAAAVVLYTVAAHVASRRLRVGALAAALTGSVAAGFRWSTPPAYRENALGTAAFLAVVAGLLWVVGNLVRGREANLRELRDTRVRLDAAHRQRERVVAAREIHDIVAHSLAVVIVQADGGRYAVEHAEPPDNARAAAVLGTIGHTARSALAEVRGVIEMLRDERGEVDAAVLDRLVGTVRAAGLAVRTTVDREAFERLPARTREALLRVVQEALTNVLRHAGPDASAEVTVAGDDQAIRVRVSNDAPRPVTGPASVGGHGLVGMRERLDELGGSLSAEPRPGGFLVEATVPR
ncbi:sensor histidine kinase [Micromonosporaceae bacterium Da 78-11]